MNGKGIAPSIDKDFVGTDDTVTDEAVVDQEKSTNRGGQPRESVLFNATVIRPPSRTLSDIFEMSYV